MPVQLVVGLGNPGSRYVDSRHNVGFQVAEALVEMRGASSWEDSLHSQVCTLRGFDRTVRMARPMTYMNRSGSAVAALAERYDLEPETILVVVDDIDLPLGRLRLRRSGGPGSHNGLRDIVDCIGTEFPRLRVGVCGEEPWDDLAEYVLSSFTEDETQLVEETVKRAADAVFATIRLGLGPAMNQYNRAAPSKDE
jgi:PTH1 family peptidyl-tRNA hydrolase